MIAMIEGESLRESRGQREMLDTSRAAHLLRWPGRWTLDIGRGTRDAGMGESSGRSLQCISGSAWERASHCV